MNGDAITNRNEALEQHLLFHKALIDDNVASDRIDRYIGLLSEDTDGERMLDPVDESIRAVFSLVLEHDMDPWEIDIREFVRLYNDKLKHSMFDMIVAGKLVLMAWKILRLQSEASVVAGTMEPEGEMIEESDDIFDLGMEEDDGLVVPNVRLTEAQYRMPVRPVTMIELLDAFEEAREEIQISADRERVRMELRAKEPKKFDNKAHEEDDEQDIERVWERIQKLGTGAFTINELYNNDIKDNITTFVSVLHLVRDGKINVWQDDLPRGDIFIEIKMDWANVKVSSVPQGQTVQEAVM